MGAAVAGVAVSFFKSLLLPIGKDIVEAIIKKVFHVEATAGAGGGAFKFEDVYVALLPEFDKLVAAGKLGGVNQDELRILLELVVKVLNALGVLKGKDTVLPAQTGSYKSGDVVQAKIL